MDSVNKSPKSEASISRIVSGSGFKNLNLDIQSKLVDSLNAEHKRKDGAMGWLLGNNSKTTIYSAVLINLFIVFFMILYIILCAFSSNFEFNMEIIKLMIPLISLSLGYIFGKGGDKVTD